MVTLLSLICKLLYCFILGTAPVVGDEVEVGTVGGGRTERVSTVTEGATWCPGLKKSQVYFLLLPLDSSSAARESKGRHITKSLPLSRVKKL